MDKGPEAFRTISEVADDLDLPQHVLRFWETRFSQIKPLKRGGGRRYYRPDDVVLLRGIKHLLYGEGYTIKGVQRILKEQGAHHVMTLWRDLEDDEVDLVPQPQMPEDFAPQRGAHLRNDAEEDESEADADSVPFEDEAPELAEDDMDEPDVPARPVLADARIEPQFDRALPTASAAPKTTPARSEGELSPNNARKLQLTLFELLECKDLLDAAR